MPTYLNPTSPTSAHLRFLSAPPRPAFALLALSCCTTLATSQDLIHKAPKQDKTIVITGATIHPVTAPDIENGTIMFRDGVITGVYDAKAWQDWTQKVSLDKNSFIFIDAAGKHVYPGFITALSQLGITEIQAVAATNDLSEVGNVAPEVQPTIAVNPDSTLLPVTRRNGILTAGVHPSGGLIPGQVGVIRLDGWTVEDMQVKIGDNIMAGLMVNWPRVRPIRAWWMDTPEEEQLKRIRENLAALEKTFDTALAYARERQANPVAPTDLRWEAMRPIFTLALAKESGIADEAGLKPSTPLFIEANDADQIASALTFCEQRNLRCVIVGGREADRAAELLKRTGTTVILRGVQNMPQRDDSPYDDAYTLPKRLHDAGITFAITHGDDTAHERNLPYAAGTAIAFGLPHDIAIKALTINPAQILGIDRQLGSLEAGKSATLFISTGDPLEVTSDINRAFIDGREIDLRTKQTELAKKYLDRYKQTGDIK